MEASSYALARSANKLNCWSLTRGEFTFLTEMHPNSLLEQKLHEAATLSRGRLDNRSDNDINEDGEKAPLKGKWLGCRNVYGQHSSYNMKGN